MKRIILSGGGTGGHIYPAVAVAEALKRRFGDEVELLFVGAEGKMEMEKVPALGYNIVGLPTAGLQRRLTLSNLLLPFKVAKSISKAKRVIREFKADVVVGFGGYASAPVLWAAQRMGVPTVIQEQNSYAGVTNKILSRRARKICVAYGGMERFFPAERILLTGNPVRQNLSNPSLSKDTATAEFGFRTDKPTILLIGGSLGARTLNESMLASLKQIKNSNIQFIWQTGSYYKEHIAEELKKHGKLENLHVTDFIRSMDMAYMAADLVISRAGASSISELCLLGKPSILVPSPNVSEDHQTHNAMALVNTNAALIVKDAEAEEKLIPMAINTVKDMNLLRTLGKNAHDMAFRDSDIKIAEEILQLIK